MRKYSRLVYRCATIAFAVLILRIVLSASIAEAVRTRPRAIPSNSDYALMVGNPFHDRRFLASAVGVAYRRCFLTARHVPLTPYRNYVAEGRDVNPPLNPLIQSVRSVNPLLPADGAWNDLQVFWVEGADGPRNITTFSARGLGKAADFDKESPIASQPIGDLTRQELTRIAFVRGYGNSGTTLVWFPIADHPNGGVYVPRDYGLGVFRTGIIWAESGAHIYSYHDGQLNNNGHDGALFRITANPLRNNSTLLCTGDSGSPLGSPYGGLPEDRVYGIISEGYNRMEPPSGQFGSLCKDVRLNYATALNSHATAPLGNFERVTRMVETTCGVHVRILRIGQGRITGGVTLPSADPYSDDANLNDTLDCTSISSDCSETLHDGETLTSTAYPDTGWIFSHWSDAPSTLFAPDERPIDRCPCNGSISATCSVPMENVGYYDDTTSYDDSTCVANFKTVYCGNNSVDDSEQCDTGSESATCDFDCTFLVCGDSHVNFVAGETCDDGNTISGDGCSSTCVVEHNYCGDGITDLGEDCDAGNGTGVGQASALCNSDCTLPICGDGIVNNLSGETCDDGNTTNGDFCSSFCQIETCGNDIIDPGEQCDGGTSGNISCTSTCTMSSCGDNIMNGAAAETCDDGNATSGDGCSSICKTELNICGDGNVDSGETCDTGYDTDVCDSDCTTVSCGDGHLNFTVEDCDDGNTMNGDGCSSLCIFEASSSSSSMSSSSMSSTSSMSSSSMSSTSSMSSSSMSSTSSMSSSSMSSESSQYCCGYNVLAPGIAGAPPACFTDIGFPISCINNNQYDSTTACEAACPPSSAGSSMSSSSMSS